MNTQVTTDKQWQSSFVSIFEAFVWPNGNEWLNGNTFNYYWEARSACSAWRGLSFPTKHLEHKAEAASLRRPAQPERLITVKHKDEKGEKRHDLLVDYEWVDNCFNMRFSVLTLLWFAQVRLHVADTCPWLVSVCLPGLLKMQSYITSPWPVPGRILNGNDSFLFLVNEQSALHISAQSYTLSSDATLFHFLLMMWTSWGGNYIESTEPCRVHEPRMWASYTWVKTSALQQLTVKTKDEHREQILLTPHYPASWPERQPLATGNSYKVSSFLQTGQEENQYLSI